MADEGAAEKALKKILLRMPQLANPVENPAQFVRDLVRQWKDDGGKLAGKPRHSDRYLEEQLSAQGNRVRSLTPKLVGKTNINPTDGNVLVRLVLSKWPVLGPDAEEVQYEALLSKTELDALGDYIEDRIEQPAAQITIPASEAVEGSIRDELPGLPNAELIAKLYKDCDALITVAPEQVFVASGPGTELIGFKNLLNLLRKIEFTDQKQRPLIWVLDLGGPSMEDLSTRRKYINVQQLIIRFKSLVHYKDPHSEELLDWLNSRAAIVLLDTYGDWRKKVSLGKLPNFFPHHATLTSTTTDWMASSNFRALFGHDLNEDRMRQRVFQVFFNASSAWSDSNVKEELRYVGYGSFKKSSGDMVGRGLELPPLPARYTEAFNTICVASASMLKIKMAPPEPFLHTEEEAIKQLEYLAFRLLNVEDFISQY